MDGHVAQDSLDGQKSKTKTDKIRVGPRRRGPTIGLRPQFQLGALSVQQDISQILDYLFLGAKGCSQDLESLKGNGIEYVINCTQDAPNVFEGCGIKYLQVPIGDAAEEPISDYFEEANEFIKDAKNEKSKTLVHCSLGMSRSVTLVLAYLIREQGMSLADALYLTKDKRPVASPNLGFMRQLVAYEQTITGHEPTISLERYAADRFGSVDYLRNDGIVMDSN